MTTQPDLNPGIMSGLTTHLEQARTWAFKVEVATHTRDAEIRSAYDHGATLDDIARATALDLPTIRRITQEDF